MTPDMLEKALEYAKRGWAVLPLLRRSKNPFKVSKGVNDRTTDTQQVNQWWKETPEANVAIATGQVSGIFVLDIDIRRNCNGLTTLNELQSRYGPLPETVTAQTGGGGRHLLFRWPGFRVKNNNTGKLGKGIDVKGDGGYIVAAPSVHETGALYEWVVGLSPDDLPPADAPAWLLEQIGEQNKLPRPVKTKRAGADTTCSPLTLDDAIRLTLPDGPGQRHRRVFMFARALKAMPEYATAPLPIIKPLVERWWKAALPFIKTQEFTETWSDFVAAWPRVKAPLGDGRLDTALNSAKLAPLPACAERYDCEGVRLLIKLCKELQSQVGDEPFYLDCRNAGRVTGCEHATANRRLNMLIADEVLALIEKGTTNHASRYRYLGG